MSDKQRFAAQVDPELLATARAIAVAEGRQFQSIVEEALLDFVEKRKTPGPRAHVMVVRRSWMGMRRKIKSSML